MDIDFEFIITVATLAAFGFWIIHKIFQPKKTKGIIHFIQSLFGVLLLVLLLRSFLFEPFRIPSSSMRPTLVIGDFVLVNKFIYGLRLPVLHTKIMDISQPQRGDIIVFRYPNNPSVDYIKRVIGVPGDTIETDGDKLMINDEEIPIVRQDSRNWINQHCEKNTSTVYTEQLPGHPHKIMLSNNIYRKIIGKWVVPTDKYFVMGDNRDNSSDSRSWGFVPEENIVGKAQAIWFNAVIFSKCNRGMKFGRIGGIESNE